MHHDFLDRYSRLQSPIHRLPATVKLGGALLIVIITVASPRTLHPFLAVMGIALVAIAGASAIPWGFIAKRLLFLEPFAVGVGVLTLLGPGGTSVFLVIVVKSSICLLAMILLSNTTPFSELLAVLRKAKVPAALVTVLALMYRYLYVVIDEAERMKRARTSRTFIRGRMRAWSSLAVLIGMLFVRSTERAERIYAAMRSRGWK